MRSAGSFRLTADVLPHCFSHEFDKGPKNLAENFTSLLAFPVVTSNIDFSASKELNGTTKSPYAIIKKANKDIGIVGYTSVATTYESSPGPNIVFHEELSSVRAAVTQLRALGVSIIIALGHSGYGMVRAVVCSCSLNANNRCSSLHVGQTLVCFLVSALRHLMFVAYSSLCRQRLTRSVP